MVDLRDLASHPVWLGILCALWAWVSLCLMMRLWHVHRNAGFVRKLVWSVVLLAPCFGWLFYAGLFELPNRHGIPAPETPGAP